MAEFDQTPESAFDRRLLLKGAAWSVPVIVAAVATPLAAASITNSSLAWTGTESGLLALKLLGSGGTVTAGAVITLPDQFTLTNGHGAIDDTATVTIVVTPPTGINLTAGKARGFGVSTLGGVNVAAQNSASYAGLFGFPTTTFTGTYHFTVASNGSVQVPVHFGLSGVHSGLVSISVLATFAVALTLRFSDGTVRTAGTSISVPIGAGIL